MIFSIDTVKNRKDKSTLSKNNFDFDKSFFSESLEMVADENYNFFRMMNELDEESLEEGIASTLVHHAIKKFDFNAFIGSIMDWFINSIGKLSGGFNAFLLNFVNDDVELKAYKNKLQSIHIPITYSKPFFEYKNLGITSDTTLRFKSDIENELQSFMSIFTDSVSSNEEFIQRINDAYNAKSDYEYMLADIRGELCGSSNPISAGDFSDKLFEYYRTTKEPYNSRFDAVEIPASRVALAAKDFYSASKQISIVKREQWKYRAEATATKTRIRAYNGISKTGVSANPEILMAYNKYCSLCCKRVQNICNLYVMAYSSKLDAIKEYNKLNKDILLIACKLITKEKL